jgi:hypothetical protein
MARTLDEVRSMAMELSDADRLQLSEQLVVSVGWDKSVRDAWITEAARRYQRLANGDDPGLTLEEFLADDIA